MSKFKKDCVLKCKKDSVRCLSSTETAGVKAGITYAHPALSGVFYIFWIENSSYDTTDIFWNEGEFWALSGAGWLEQEACDGERFCWRLYNLANSRTSETSQDVI